MARLSRDFFSRYTPDVARDVLGSTLVRRIGDEILTARIVETEAYRGADDPASHAYRGLTKRTAVMFGEAGHAYVYFTYGNHYCLNITTEKKGEAGAVLIRAVAPLTGIDEMKKRRRRENVVELTSGPGKLTQAMDIDGALNGEDLVNSKVLYLLKGQPVEEVAVSTRIGLSMARETKWRYYVKDSPFVSPGRMHNYRTKGQGERGVVG